MNKHNIYPRIIVNLLLAVIGVIGIIVFVPKLIGFFLPFVIGWIVAMIANPLVNFLEKKVNIVRKWSSGAIIILVLGGVFLGVYFIASALIEQSRTFVHDLPEISKNLESLVTDMALQLHQRYTFIPEQLIEAVENFLLHLDENINAFIGTLEIPSLSSASNIVKTVGDVFFNTIVAIISSYFFIAEKDLIIEKLKKNSPDPLVEYCTMISSNFKQAVGGYFKAQLKIMLVIMAILYIGFQIMGVDYSIFLAFGVAFLDFLPVFGTGAIIWPWAIFDLFNGKYSAAIFLMVIYLICQIVKQVLQPKMVGDSVGMSPIATLFFLYIGYKVKGILGIIIGIPVGMIIINLYRAGAFSSLIRGVQILARDINEYRKF